MSESVDKSSESLGSTSSDLLERVRARDEDAWRRLVQLYGPLVLHWCRRFGLQEADRSDVFQDVFRAVARHVADFRRERPTDTFRGWLHKVAQSKLREHFRRHGCNPDAVGGSSVYQRLLAVPDTASGSDDQPLSNDDAVLLREVLRLLRSEFRDQTWQAFWRTTADGLPATVVAQELGMSPGAVRTAKSRVLRRLRQELRGDQ
jgi:RNA polymerase sigma-70 factor (ECF subfamily)